MCDNLYENVSPHRSGQKLFLLLSSLSHSLFFLSLCLFAYVSLPLHMSREREHFLVLFKIQVDDIMVEDGVPMWFLCLNAYSFRINLQSNAIF